MGHFARCSAHLCKYGGPGYRRLASVNGHREATKGELSVVAEERATETRTVISLSRKRKQDPSAFRGWLLGVKYRLSSRKWANGVPGNVAGGE